MKYKPILAKFESIGIVVVAINLVYLESTRDILNKVSFTDTYSPGYLLLRYAPTFALVSPNNLYGLFIVPFPPLTNLTFGFNTIDGLIP